MGIDCIICQSEIQPKDNNAFSTLCGHVFHKLCINEYLLTNNSCPCCRMVCSIKQLFQLFTNISNISNDAIECDEIEKDDCDSLLHKINVLTAQLKIKDEKFEDLNKTIKNTSNSIICFEEMNEKLEEENIQKEESIKMIEKTYYECPSMKAQHYYSTTLYR